MSPIFSQIIVMFTIMPVGFACAKAKLITPEVNKGFSNLALMVVNPLMTFSSYQTDYSPEIARGLLHAFLLSIASFALQIFISHILVGKGSKEYKIERMSVMLSNCSYFGLPLVQSVYGKEGIIYLTAYVTVFNLINWTYGLCLMSGERDVRKMLRSFVNPAIISVALGATLFFLNFKLPPVLLSTVKTVGSMNTPIAMMIAGSTLAGTKFERALKNVKVYYVCLLKLIVVPAVVMVFMLLVGKRFASPEVINIILIASACPTATIITMFSHRYSRNSVYSSEIFAVCTLLSAITLPAMLKIASIIGI